MPNYWVLVITHLLRDQKDKERGRKANGDKNSAENKTKKKVITTRSYSQPFCWDVEGREVWAGFLLSCSSNLSQSRTNPKKCYFSFPPYWRTLSFLRLGVSFSPVREENCFARRSVSNSQGWLCRILKWAKTCPRNKGQALTTIQLLGSVSSDLWPS